MPYAQQIQGSARDQIRVRWPTAVRGTVLVQVRMDNR
jgi:hypothetical protein